MSRKKPSYQVLRSIRSDAKSELLRLEKILSDTETQQLLDKFKNKFNLCESVYKTVLTEYQVLNGKKVDKHPKITMSQVPYALAFAGYSFEHGLLNELFGSKSQKGTTAKKLRDAVTHGVNEKAVKEIMLRKDELFGYMNSFLHIIRTFDDNAA